MKEKLVPFDRGRRGIDPARMREFAATARKLQEERETTAAAVSVLLRETVKSEWARLAEREELRNSGAIDRLCHEAADRLERDPRGALVIANAAIDLARAVADDAYPSVVVAQLRAHAAKSRAQAYRYVTRYDDALADLDRAEEVLAPFGTVSHDLAIVRFERAIVLQHLRRFDEAHALLSECRAVFRDHGDQVLLAKATLSTANLLVRRGDYRAAREVLLSIVGRTDAETNARVHTALGWTATELDLHDEAIDYFTTAAEGFRSLGASIEVLRADYGKGHALLRRGSLDNAKTQLQVTRERLLMHRMVEEAGLCALDMVEVHLIEGERVEAKRLATRLVQEFTAASLNRRAVTALAYLNDMLESDSAPTELVRNVSEYLVHLRVDPNRDFCVN